MPGSGSRADPTGGPGMIWRVGLIDSCGAWNGATAAAAFASAGTHIERRPPGPDPTGHGSRVAGILTSAGAPVELLLGQVFSSTMPASAAAVAAAIDWARSHGAHLIHLSLGLTADRGVLREAVARARSSGVVLVAAMPARGTPVYPAGYASVIGGTGDARCGPDEVSVLGPRLFGAFLGTAHSRSGGASIGAAWVSRTLVRLPSGTPAGDAIAGLRAMARYQGPERRRKQSPNGPVQDVNQPSCDPPRSSPAP